MGRFIYGCLVAFVCCSNYLFPEKYSPFLLVFRPVFGEHTLQLSDTTYTLANGGTIEISMLKFYISHVEFLQNDSVVWGESNSYHLIDASDEKSLSISLPANSSPTHIQFNLGIDSTANSSGAMGGDLDPTKGMYWTWQSGYINFKLEGKSTVCKTRNNEFTFHIGGYQYPFNSLQKIKIALKNRESSTVRVDIEKILNSIDISEQNHVMSPSKEAIEFSKKVAAVFQIQQQ
jgi:hypothetical protein